MRVLPPLLLLAPALLLGGCFGKDEAKVVEIEIHVGKAGDDPAQQYMTPASITVRKGDKVRLVITNDDTAGTPDSFHSVALLGYDGDRDGEPDDIVHEVPAGATVTTDFKGRSHFTASKRGTFDLICDIRRGQPTSHEAAGMRADFVVA